MGRSQLICTGGCLMVTVQYSNYNKDDKNEAFHTQYLFCTDVPHRGPAFHAAGTAASSKDVVRRSLISDESELALAGAVAASADLASQISKVKSKEGLKKCTACRKRVGLTGFSCKYGNLFCAVQNYSDKHKCPFDYRNAGQNAIAKANPIIVVENHNKI
ncbi:hypothetical protein CQW23_30779 [Capsicum baccatum]|uniref:AN1-type domain-containing protein n=1 Tax=Capsicum baccatum TaxID=33114 RepID=A0A2G2V9F8_CAPBA|nr:hypothetical protein CQW23_30779 [Capsicum baccatum]